MQVRVEALGSSTVSHAQRYWICGVCLACFRAVCVCPALVLSFCLSGPFGVLSLTDLNDDRAKLYLKDALPPLVLDILFVVLFSHSPLPLHSPFLLLCCSSPCFLPYSSLHAPNFLTQLFPPAV